MSSIHKTEYEKFEVTLSSSWNISGFLYVGPKIGNFLIEKLCLACNWKLFNLFKGISYQTHPQANLTQVATFKDINRITTLFLPKDDSNAHSITPVDYQTTAANSMIDDPVQCRTSMAATFTCRCRELKTQVRITTISNVEDLVITCTGYNVSIIFNKNTI